MGTRNLTVVMKDGTHKVAQYGQWDGYPSGQGVTALAFVSDPAKVELLRGTVDKVRFISSEERKEIMKMQAPDLADLEWVTMDQAKRIDEIFPGQSRDHGAAILDKLVTSDDPNVLLLRDDYSFGFDSLFCEWAYVVNLDTNCLEVYTGFQTAAHEDGPWADPEREHVTTSGDNYFGIRKVVEFAFAALPDESEFISVIGELTGEEKE